MNRPIVLMGAMEGEVKAFHNALESTTIDEWNDFKFYKGTLNHKEVIVSRCGVGKVLSAMVTQKIIETYSPEAIIFTGIAGSLNDLLRPGDIIVARDSVQHDFDAMKFKFLRGEIPYSGYRFIGTDESLREKALAFESELGSVCSGRILTGDQFISDRTSPERAYLTDELKGDCIDMEGASVALVSTVNGIPHLLIRTISDMADGKNKVNLRELLPRVSENSLKMVLHIIETL